MELSAVLRLQAKDIDASTRTVFADGSKTDYRSRYVTVDAWAWQFVYSYTSTVHVGRAFPSSEKTKGRALRETFYRAQVRAEMCEAPPTSDAGYEEWGSVTTLHTIHDCRSTYAVCRGMGLDGEPAQDNTYLANQLRHANETMVTRFYKHLSPARRRQLVAEAERMKQSAFAVSVAAV